MTGPSLSPDREEEGLYTAYLLSRDEVRLLSAGLDVGSTSTHLILSRLVLQRQGRPLPSRYVVVSREVLYRSPVALTPLRDPATLDTEALEHLITGWYQEAGIAPQEVDAGAVILTGLAAEKANAHAVADLLADEAGRFVCATAGHHLEAAIAAHGSGAVARSWGPAALPRTVLNLDIGGGTTKATLASGGRLLSTAALHVGARLVILDDQERIVRFEEPALRIARDLGLTLEAGALLGQADRERFADRMAGVIFDWLGPRQDALTRALQATAPLDGHAPPQAIVVSGGVSEYVYGYEQRRYGDLGPELGAAVRRRLDAGFPHPGPLPQGEREGAASTSAGSVWTVEEPTERIRATVIGASQYVVQVSGATIHVGSPGALPLRNLPVLALPRTDEPPTAGEVAGGIGRALLGADFTPGQGPVAVALRWPHPPAYSLLRELGTGLLQGLGPAASAAPLVLVCDADVGHLLGRLVRDELGYRGDLIAIDEVELGQLDYVDVGTPLQPSGVVPVTIKSLVFH